MLCFPVCFCCAVLFGLQTAAIGQLESALHFSVCLPSGSALSIRTLRLDSITVNFIIIPQTNQFSIHWTLSYCIFMQPLNNTKWLYFSLFCKTLNININQQHMYRPYLIYKCYELGDKSFTRVRFEFLVYKISSAFLFHTGPPPCIFSSVSVCQTWTCFPFFASPWEMQTICDKLQKRFCLLIYTELFEKLLLKSPVTSSYSVYASPTSIVLT